MTKDLARPSQDARQVAAAMPQPRSDAALRAANHNFYDPLWAGAGLVDPERFNTWPLVALLVRPGQPRIEVGPGLRPRLPLAETAFVDLSAPAVAKLRASGERGVEGWITALPFPDGCFELVCALDIVEHVDDEDLALSELARVDEVFLVCRKGAAGRDPASLLSPLRIRP